MPKRTLSHKNRHIGFKIEYPRESSELKDEFLCYYEAFGFQESCSGDAVGIDELDAFVNGMLRLDMFIARSQEFRSGELSWEGGFNARDFGLPRRVVD